jgi:hypothetical protein
MNPSYVVRCICRMMTALELGILLKHPYWKECVTKWVEIDG